MTLITMMAFLWVGHFCPGEAWRLGPWLRPNWDISESFPDIFEEIGTISMEIGTSGEIPGHLGKIWDVFHRTRMIFQGRTVGKWDAAVGTLLGRRILVQDVGITSESQTFWDILFVHGLLCSGRLELQDPLGLKRRGTSGTFLGRFVG